MCLICGRGKEGEEEGERAVGVVVRVGVGRVVEVQAVRVAEGVRVRLQGMVHFLSFSSIEAIRLTTLPDPAALHPPTQAVPQRQAQA